MVLSRLRRGREPESPPDAFAGYVARHCSRGQRIGVLHDTGAAATVAALRKALGETVSAYELSAPADQLHVLLAAGGPFDVLVDASTTSRAPIRTFRGTFFHVRGGGTWISRADADRKGRGRLGRFLFRSLNGSGDKEVSADDRSLLDAIETFQMEEGNVRLTLKAHDVKAKLDEAQGTAYLRLRPDLGDRVLDVVPGVRFESRCALRTSSGRRTAAEPPTYEAPDVA
ncbi:MAG: hypothetical protein QM655_15105, partial [Nocardioidaceae bacterium]